MLGGCLVLSHAAPPSNYYDAAIGLTGTSLKAALNNIIDGHTVIPYTSSSTDTWDAIMVLDEAPGDPASVTLVYSAFTNLKSNNLSGGGSGVGKWDREHLVPQSYGLVEISDNSRAKTDLFNLRSIDNTVNGTRGNLYYDTSTAPVQMHEEAPESSYDANSWEPRDADKGVVARAAFYMATRYDGADSDVPDLELAETPNAATFLFGKLSVLLAWHRAFPPTAAERQRNQTIYDDYQHNRNPFIDHPEWADIVFASVTPAQAWKNVRFTASELATPGISGDTADPDKDGYANLVEYTLRTEPRQPQTTPALTATTTTISGTRYIYLAYPRNRHAADVAISYQGSPDCVNWSTITPQPVSTTVLDFETEQVTVRIPSAAAKYFLRLRVTR